MSTDLDDQFAAAYPSTGIRAPSAGQLWERGQQERRRRRTAGILGGAGVAALVAVIAVGGALTLPGTEPLMPVIAGGDHDIDDAEEQLAPAMDTDAPDALVDLVRTGTVSPSVVGGDGPACRWIGPRAFDLHGQRTDRATIIESVRQVLADEFGDDLGDEFGDVPDTLDHLCGLSYAAGEATGDHDPDRLAELFTPADPTRYQPDADQRAQGYRSLSQHEHAWIARLSPHLPDLCPWVLEFPTGTQGRHLANGIVELRGGMPDRHDHVPAAFAAGALCGVVG